MSLESIRKRLRSKTPPPMSTQQPSMHLGYIRKRLRSKTYSPQTFPHYGWWTKPCTTKHTFAPWDKRCVLPFLSLLFNIVDTRARGHRPKSTFLAVPTRGLFASSILKKGVQKGMPFVVCSDVEWCKVSSINRLESC